eukprot:scaffold3038_cov163-Amphora_coffeaeformis.AAC.6
MLWYRTLASVQIKRVRSGPGSIIHRTQTSLTVMTTINGYDDDDDDGEKTRKTEKVATRTSLVLILSKAFFRPSVVSVSYRKLNVVAYHIVAKSKKKNNRHHRSRQLIIIPSKPTIIIAC